MWNEERAMMVPLTRSNQRLWWECAAEPPAMLSEDRPQKSETPPEESRRISENKSWE